MEFFWAVSVRPVCLQPTWQYQIARHGFDKLTMSGSEMVSAAFSTERSRSISTAKIRILS
jgi:hypothetical protein